ncbi:MAG: hypothetical protein LBC76_12075 [Treponema sp.]|nr:hypothetical protein [Treponema sp.]
MLKNSTCRFLTGVWQSHCGDIARLNKRRGGACCASGASVNKTRGTNRRKGFAERRKLIQRYYCLLTN